jgi:hypothetical protein
MIVIHYLVKNSGIYKKSEIKNKDVLIELKKDINKKIVSILNEVIIVLDIVNKKYIYVLICKFIEIKKKVKKYKEIKKIVIRHKINKFKIIYFEFIYFIKLNKIYIKIKDKFNMYLIEFIKKLYLYIEYKYNFLINNNLYIEKRIKYENQAEYLYLIEKDQKTMEIKNVEKVWKKIENKEIEDVNLKVLYSVFEKLKKQKNLLNLKDKTSFIDMCFLYFQKNKNSKYLNDVLKKQNNEKNTPFTGYNSYVNNKKKK